MSHPPSDFDIELRMLVEAVYLKYNYDFRDYTGASQKRRVLVALREMDCATVSELQARVLHQPEAFTRLLQVDHVLLVSAGATWHTATLEGLQP